MIGLPSPNILPIKLLLAQEMGCLILYGELFCPRNRTNFFYKLQKLTYSNIDLYLSYQNSSRQEEEEEEKARAVGRYKNPGEGGKQ